MPHIVVEYTNNLKDETDISQLLKSLHGVLIDRSSIFPIGGIRSRAIELQTYYVADGTVEDAYVHVTFKIFSGRSKEVKEETCKALFEVVTDHFSDIFDRRSLALSMELVELNETGSFIINNIHQRYK
ncbi:5-carboxymethyl-2-hydroxymuconate Delta-isomerase [Paenisporosarcina sp. TG20]|uniref:5-carboxymethyl-2-hydroxymuconate Delta-isomerase n=1 Tax=Paenisporosarcina sp. TG20 TaxID=1211706 RepID=UPI0002F46BBB|nr:5-carboxymethyl-2-hydroxymuconate Delta-isomerase [Paenisporosarcina sp. TG20]